MKLKAKQKLRDLSASKLAQELDKAQIEIVELHLKIKAGKEKNLRAAKTKRKEVALLKTLIREQELAADEKVKNSADIKK